MSTRYYRYSVDWGVASYAAPVEDPAVVAARQEAAALSAAVARIDDAARRLEQLGQKVAQGRSQYGDAISGLDVRVARTHPNSASADGEAQRLKQLLREREAQLRNELGKARKSVFVSQLAGAGATGASGDRLAEAIAAASNWQGPSLTDSESDVAAKHVADCARIYDRLRSDPPSESLDSVERTFKAAVEAVGQDRAPMLLDALRAAVTDANAVAAERDRRLAQIEALELQLDEPDAFLAQDAARLRELLIDERSGTRGIDAIRAEMDVCRLAANRHREAKLKQRERSVVADALEDAFEELGYQVQDGFETALADDGTAYVRRDGWSDHAVCVRIDHETDQLRFNVVRDDKPQLISADSVRREEEFCADHVALEQALGRRGVGLGAEVLMPPGVVEVAAVPFEQTKLPTAGRVKRAERSRTRSR